MKTAGRRSAALGQARCRALRSGVTVCRSATRLVWPCTITGAEQLCYIWSGIAWHQPQMLDAIHSNSLRHQQATKCGDWVCFRL
jgi:hypothetical protein